MKDNKVWEVFEWCVRRWLKLVMFKSLVWEKDRMNGEWVENEYCGLGRCFDVSIWKKGFIGIDVSMSLVCDDEGVEGMRKMWRDVVEFKEMMCEREVEIEVKDREYEKVKFYFECVDLFVVDDLEKEMGYKDCVLHLEIAGSVCKLVGKSGIEYDVKK